MAFKGVLKGKRKGGFPFLVIIMLIILLIAYIVGGKELLFKAIIREVAGVAFTLILMITLRKVKKAKAKRK